MPLWRIAGALGKNRPEYEGLTAAQRRAKKIEEQRAAGDLPWLDDEMTDAEDAQLRAMAARRGGG